MTDLSKLLYPKDAAEAMGISLATVTRCVKKGAPVHRWGSIGYRYRIDVEEFVAWMEDQRYEAERKRLACISYDVQAMAEKRRAMMRAI